MTVIMILAKRLLILLMSTSGKSWWCILFLLPVAEAVFDIGDEADQRDATPTIARPMLVRSPARM
jgi:hypothetical protein